MNAERRRRRAAGCPRHRPAVAEATRSTGLTAGMAARLATPNAAMMRPMSLRARAVPDREQLGQQQERPSRRSRTAPARAADRRTCASRATALRRQAGARGLLSGIGIRNPADSDGVAGDIFAPDFFRLRSEWDRLTLSAAGERGWDGWGCSAVAHALSGALDDDEGRRKRAGAVPALNERAESRFMVRSRESRIDGALSTAHANQRLSSRSPVIRLTFLNTAHFWRRFSRFPDRRTIVRQVEARNTSSPLEVPPWVGRRRRCIFLRRRRPRR